MQRDGSCTTGAENEEEFKPTPIPLSAWPRDKPEPAGTLQEIIKSDAAPVAAVPAHYWEDALRHSVYLTLVRDKIDELIAKGDYISPDSKPDNMGAKVIDDHDLWDKIKTARFDRLKEEPIQPADVTILARGRLVEDVQGYRFIEDDAQNNCSDSSCTKGVKALWSVKRMRQGETSPGKYHYELTFSVTSQTGERKMKKSYENPVRTFTIKETTNPVGRPRGKTIYHHDKPQRAIWVHRNIKPITSYHKRPAKNTHGLDRIFSSLFSDEDSYEEPYRHKPKTLYANVYPQLAKVAHVDDREPYHQKKLLPYPMQPQSHRYMHSPVVPPPPPYVQHPYLTADAVGNLPFIQTYTDNRYLPSNIIKTTRPAVLPTPITNYPLLKESTIEVPVKTKPNGTEYTTKEPDVVSTFKIYHHQKQKTPMKISYASDHIRPPVYNAPPGVFVTMDKKPFKPMPPLKYSHMNKPQKTILSDFRPSPQLDTQYSEHDYKGDTAFRPITMDFTEYDVKDDNFNKKNNNVRKPGASKKPGKKHEHIKSSHLTTITPEIITAESLSVQDDDIIDDEMEWANILGAFTKTTPMASHREQSTKENIDTITSTTPLSTTVTSLEEIAESTEEEEITSSSSTTTPTTPKLKKRTRPPPKFNKTEKIKKHKRVTSTTTTTLKPTRKYLSKKPTHDLTPQASSAATSSTNPIRETKTPKPPASTTTSSTTPRPTTTVKLATSTSSTTSTLSPTVDTEQPVVTTQPKSKNRFRQSTLMQKGTSVNHDKWSTSTFDQNRTNTATLQSYPRRKASKFTGYIPASTPRSPEVERNREDHRDHVYNFNKERISSTTEKVDDDILVKKTLHPTLPTDEQLEMKDDMHSEWSNDDESEQQKQKSVTESDHRRNLTDVQESKDNIEYIFPTASVIQEVKEYIGLTDEAPTTISTVVASPYSNTKNKTKCKKKKHNNLTTTEGASKLLSEPKTTDKPETSSMTTTTTSTGASDIFNELFGGFTMDDVKGETATERSTSAPEVSSPAAEQKPSESEKHERYLHLDDDLEEFLYSLDQKSNHQAHDDKLDEDYDDGDDIDDESSPYNIDEDSKLFKDDYYEDAQESKDQPFSLLEFMDNID